MCNELTAVQYTFIVFMSTDVSLYLRTHTHTHTYTHTCARTFTTVRSLTKETRRYTQHYIVENLFTSRKFVKH